MEESGELGPAVTFTATRYEKGVGTPFEQSVASEVPLTLIANDIEVATLLCSPTDLKEFALGFLFASGLIRGREDLLDFAVDPTRWTARCRLSRQPDLSLLQQRVYTSGCGRGVMYANVVELAGRTPLRSDLTIPANTVHELATWLQRSSTLYRGTHGVHTAGLSLAGAPPERAFDDIGRHSAIDKAIGDGLARGIEFGRCVLLSSGRTSSEVLHKARRAGIPICVSRSAPTHQAVLRAREGGVTLVGLARGGCFTVFTHGERIVEGMESSPELTT